MIHCQIQLCVGCRRCEVACSSFHFGAVSPALSRIRVAKLETIGIDMAVTCLSCQERPCLECPTEALRMGARGEVVLDAPLCNGCAICVEACPIGAVGLARDIPLFCDLCGGDPSCRRVCPSGALSHREEAGAVSLGAYLTAAGRPSQKRADYVRMLAQPVREAWKRGARVEP